MSLDLDSCRVEGWFLCVFVRGAYGAWAITLDSPWQTKGPLALVFGRQMAMGLGQSARNGTGMEQDAFCRST